MDTPNKTFEPKRRWRPQFALSTLLLLVLLFGTVTLLVLIKRDLDASREENAALLKELGRFVITNPEKIYVSNPALDFPPKWAWRWRVYLPKERSYTVCAKLYEIGIEEIPFSSEGMRLPSGEFTLDVRLQQDRKEWSVVISHQGSAEELVFDEDGPGFLESNTVQIAASRDTQMFPPDAPLELLRIRKTEQRVKSPRSMENVLIARPCPGLLIWIQEDRAVPLK